MNCPTCGKPTRVVDTRDVEVDGDMLRKRRRVCLCGERFSTWECYEQPDLEAEVKLKKAHDTLAQIAKAAKEAV